MMRLYTVILDQDITYGIFKHWGCVLQVVSQVSIGFLFGFHCNDDLLHNMRVKKQHNYEGCHVRIVKGHQVILVPWIGSGWEDGLFSKYSLQTLWLLFDWHIKQWLTHTTDQFFDFIAQILPATPICMMMKMRMILMTFNNKKLCPFSEATSYLCVDFQATQAPLTCNITPPSILLSLSDAF